MRKKERAQNFPAAIVPTQLLPDIYLINLFLKGLATKQYSVARTMELHHYKPGVTSLQKILNDSSRSTINSKTDAFSTNQEPHT